MNARHNRGPYEGAVQILRFNAGKYYAAGGGMLAGALAWPLLSPAVRGLLLIGAAPALFWMASSLVVSHYVYDRFPIYDFRQIARQLTATPRRWIQIHCGWDEASEGISEAFPGASGQVVDIFDLRVMTESSIQRARSFAANAMRAMPGSYGALPFEGNSFDAAFAIFAAHELRRHEQRVDLFREIARLLTAGGEFVLMEHTRDWRNFLAFGPGFLHFLSRRAWRRAAFEAGLEWEKEIARTPFVHVYILMRRKG